MSDYYATKNTAMYGVEAVSMSAEVAAFQFSAFQEDAFQTSLGAEWTVVHAEKNTAQYVAEKN